MPRFPRDSRRQRWGQTEREADPPPEASPVRAEPSRKTLPPTPGEQALAGAAAFFPGVLVHGTGSYVLGRPETGTPLLWMEVGGLGLTVGSLTALALTGAALAAVLAVQKPNSRAAESEADRIGIELAAKAGYNPSAAVTLWQKMAEVGGKGPPEFLSTHPAPENREKKLAALVPKMMPYYQQKGKRPSYKL